ncbi:hypothetical protein [Streptomyces sp. AK02-04a]|uniref:hypothetical protein n=1 Tax=Streptomyces sp. AK02-04a TaxID=3028649 RepID=UPI0029AEE12E|nr:hypothetical protein [Streptomyces sp. AK02-04a]MDX3762567.1 hypothetical protein [Streptomyces sp. AK02-04a]
MASSAPPALGWPSGLKGFVVALSEIVDYRFDTLDREAIEAGVDDRDDDGGRRFTYLLVGGVTLDIDSPRSELPTTSTNSW